LTFFDGAIFDSGYFNSSVVSNITASAILLREQVASFCLDAFIVNPYRAQHDRGDGPLSRSPHYDTDLDSVITLSKALGVYAEGQDLHSVLSSIVGRVSTLEGS
jgi:hypothetical protein